MSSQPLTATASDNPVNRLPVSGAGAGNPPPASLQWAGVTALLGCGSYELNRLLRERIAPLPVRIDGITLWYRDEIDAKRPAIDKALKYWRSRKRPEVRHETPATPVAAVALPGVSGQCANPGA